MFRRIDINTIRVNPNAGRTTIQIPGRRTVEHTSDGITIRTEMQEIRTMCPAPKYLFKYEDLIVQCGYCGFAFRVDELEDDWDENGNHYENGCPWCNRFNCCAKIELEVIEDALKRRERMSHFKEVCSDCKKIITQCRCPSTDKQVIYSVCKECKTIRNKPARLLESSELIREHLVKLHDDGDDNSLFVRFNQILQHVENLTQEIKMLQRLLEKIK